MQRQTIVAGFVTLFFLTAVFAFAGDKAEVKGIIISRTGETLIINNPDGKTTVLLTDDTKTQDRKGLFGLDKHLLSSAVLIPGLKVKVQGTSDDQGRIVAKTITTNGDDLETAQMIQAGLHPTAEQVAANLQSIQANREAIAGHATQLAAQKEDIETNQQQIAQNMNEIEEHTNRFMSLQDYDVKAQATLKFGVGSSKLDSADQEKLKTLAQTATGITGYMIEVVGYADSTGSAAMNTKLSEQRAQAAATYLLQQCNVPVRHIIAPGAMGEYGEAASNETKAGRAENRRVEVKVLVNKGIAGS